MRISIPLDSDGFLRRECPTCEREFKWLPSSHNLAEDSLTDDAALEAPSAPRYFCPYCGVQAAASSWLTKAQVGLAHAIVMRDVVGPQLQEFQRELEHIGRESGGLLTFKTSIDSVEDAPEPTLTETDDMRRVDFLCHPSEPVKVLDGWDGDVFCLVCGIGVAPP
jgi:hypothetical protein